MGLIWISQNSGPAYYLWSIETPFAAFSRGRDINSKANAKKAVIDIPLRLPSSSFMICLIFTSLCNSRQRARMFYSMQSHMYSDCIFRKFPFLHKIVISVDRSCRMERNNFSFVHHGLLPRKVWKPWNNHIFIPISKKAYLSYTNTEENVLQGSFVIKLPGCYLFVITLESVSIVFPLLIFHVSVNINPHSFVDISLKSLFC